MDFRYDVKVLSHRESMDCNIDLTNWYSYVDRPPWDKLCLFESKMFENISIAGFLLPLPSF